MPQVAGMIARVLNAPDDPAVIEAVRREVEVLCERFPVCVSPFPSPG
jgi:glycine/serine hydroxymethyltransferase